MNTELLITHESDIDIFDFLRDGETEYQALERARFSIREWIKDLEANIISCPEMTEHWNERIAVYTRELETLRIESYTDYCARKRKMLLDPSATETTAEHFEEMLDVLPPCAHTNNERYEMFFIEEAFSGSYHSFYLHDKTTGKYWTKLGDTLDRSTWLDVVLGLRAA